MHSKLKIGEMNYFTLHCRLISNRKVHVLYVHVKLNHSRGAAVFLGGRRPPPPPPLNAALMILHVRDGFSVKVVTAISFSNHTLQCNSVV